MELKDYTTEELRAEIKRRYELAKEAKKKKRAKMQELQIFNAASASKHDVLM